MRVPPSEQDLAVKDKGIDALVTLECVPPSRPVDTGRRGAGGLGCKLDLGEGKGALHVKRWAFRDGVGMLEVGDFENGKRTGTWKQYYPNGFLAAEGEFVDDQRNGVWNEWDDTGRQTARTTYDHGPMHGVSVNFSGPQPFVQIYFHGRPVGPNGQVEPPHVPHEPR